jgi:periplasmic divalent cation tolerance protein
VSAALIYITASDFEEAERIARGLVEGRLVACANIVPRITSIYWWDDQVCEEEETLIVAKTARELVDQVVQAVKKAHSAEVPAILAIDVVDGNTDFINWLHGEVRKRADS